ncbi:hypothetical protein LINGRAHAP2_LOCUS18195 [Linum grandiflorum]
MRTIQYRCEMLLQIQFSKFQHLRFPFLESSGDHNILIFSLADFCSICAILPAFNNISVTSVRFRRTSSVFLVFVDTSGAHKFPSFCRRPATCCSGWEDPGGKSQLQGALRRKVIYDSSIKRCLSLVACTIWFSCPVTGVLRQKQYFEQKRRQQRQQMGGVESYCEEKKTCEQNQKEHRSLDVLSLLNLSTDSPLSKPGNASPCDNYHKHNAGFSKVNASEVQCNFPKDAPVTVGNSFTPTDSLEIREGNCLGNQAENASPKKFRVTAAENNPDVSGGVEHEIYFQETATQKKLSVFDLLDDDDGGNLKSSKSPAAHEAHVAFSVDGLGNVGAETPVQSPLQPDRCGSHDYFTPSKAARQNNVKIHNDFEREVEAMMQDIGLPPTSNHFDFSRSDQLHGKLKNLHTSRDYGRLDSHYRDTSSSYRDKIKPHRQTNFDLCDASPALLDEDFIDEKNYNTFWSTLPHGTHDESAHLKSYGSTGLEDYSFESSHVRRKKRNCIKEVDEYDILDSLARTLCVYRKDVHQRK